MKLMIIQPMKGKSEEQVAEERHDLVKKLEKEGHTVENISYTMDYIVKDRPNGTNLYLWAISKHLKILSQVDGAIVMPGWDTEEFSRIEEACAREYCKYIRYYY